MGQAGSPGSLRVQTSLLCLSPPSAASPSTVHCQDLAPWKPGPAESPLNRAPRLAANRLRPPMMSGRRRRMAAAPHAVNRLLSSLPTALMKRVCV